MFQTFLKLAAIAHPVIQNYAADFYLHDAKVLADMRPGDVAIWAPRRDGSCLVIVARHRIGNERAMESFRAFRSSFPDLQWQVIDTDVKGDWTVEPIANPESLIRDYTEAAQLHNQSRLAMGEQPEIVRELHM